MAKEIAENVTAWKKVEASVEHEDTGNILVPLERMYDHYVAKACRLYEQALEDAEKGDRIRANADYYKRAAEAVRGVINQ
jgi:hypothetical protein